MYQLIPYLNWQVILKCSLFLISMKLKLYVQFCTLPAVHIHIALVCPEQDKWRCQSYEQL